MMMSKLKKPLKAKGTLWFWHLSRLPGDHESHHGHLCGIGEPAGSGQRAEGAEFLTLLGRVSIQDSSLLAHRLERRGNGMKFKIRRFKFNTDRSPHEDTPYRPMSEHLRYIQNPSASLRQTMNLACSLGLAFHEPTLCYALRLRSFEL